MYKCFHFATIIIKVTKLKQKPRNLYLQHNLMIEFRSFAVSGSLSMPAKQPVERSASVAVGGGGGMRRKATINSSECSLYPPMGSLRPHLGLTRGEYTSITDDIESFSMTRFARPRATSPLTHTFGPSFSRQSSADYQTLLSVESEILHGAEEADYYAMEGLIKRRLHRDSENLTVSLEELCSVKGESDSELEDNERRNFCTLHCGGLSPSPSAPNVTIDPASDSSLSDSPLPKSQSAHSIQTLKSTNDEVGPCLETRKETNI